MKKVFIIICFLFSFNAVALDSNIYYFISLRSDEVNLRSGPGNEYPIKCVYQIQDMPLKVLGEYENWYKTQDKDSEEGWINKNLATKRRNLIVLNGTQIMYKKDNIKSNPIFRLEENVVVKYNKCNSNWCKVSVNGKDGWVEKQNLWGYDY